MRRRYTFSSEADLPFLRWYLLLILGVFVLLLGRLFYMQVLKHDEYERKRLSNLIETVEIDPPRGTIMDRAGRILAEDEHTYALLYKPPLDLTQYFLDQSTLEFITQVNGSRLITLLELCAIRADAREDGRDLPSAGAKDLSRLPPVLSSTEHRWLKRLTRAELDWIVSLAPSQLNALAELRANPAFLHPRVVQYTSYRKEQPYLHQRTGEPISAMLALADALAESGSEAEELSYSDLMERCGSELRRKYLYQPFKLIDALTPDQVAWIEEHREEIPAGEFLIGEFAYRRKYPLGSAAAHVVGYTGLAQPTDAWAIEGLGFAAGSLVGKEGIEREMEGLLHGYPGKMDISVSHAGEMREIVREVPPVQGAGIYLTIDNQVQAEANRLLAGRPGSIVVCALAGEYAGEILALASSPGFDPNRFAERGYYSSLIVDAAGRPNANLPLLNRAYGLAFPPGSTFKIVTAQAALESGEFSLGSGYYCQGYIELGRNKRRYHCHDRTGHRELTFLEGISESCDVVFYETGLGMGDPAPDVIRHYAELYGFGRPTGIGLPGEANGTVPDKAWKRATYAWANEVDRLWYDGDTVNYAIGQGFLLATPIQVLWSSNLVAWNGLRHSPRLLKAQLVDGVIIQEPSQPPENRQLDLTALDGVRQGMRLAVSEGTCRQLNIEGLEVNAKSGTAETGKPDEEDHSWVTGYYPDSDPQYGFVCFFQNGGSSGDAAIPAARQLLQFLKDQDPLARSEQHGDD